MTLLSELAVLATVLGGMCLYAATARRLARHRGEATDARAGRVQGALVRVGLSLFGSGGATMTALLASGSFELP
ncbi:MAG TPA: hypothetical protein VFJ14_13755 [Nocardioidaceae bacterium]|jgi:hypothetical protein|nr:hypothetical protein [Nocardioidaceae bacterium]